MTSHQAGGVPAQITELRPSGKLKSNTAQTPVGDALPVAAGSRESESWCKSHLLLEQAPADRFSLLPGDGNRSRGMKVARKSDVLVILYSGIEWLTRTLEWEGWADLARHCGGGSSSRSH